MKALKTKETKEINWALPNQTVSHNEFMSAIHKAEEGSFYTLEEIKGKMTEWKKSRNL